MQHPFTLGDRVQITIEQLPTFSGRCGVIVRRFANVSGFYEVQLDGEQSLRLFSSAHLALMPPQLPGETSEPG